MAKRRWAYPRDCPRCGAGTTVTGSHRNCDAADCLWYVSKAGVPPRRLRDE